MSSAPLVVIHGPAGSGKSTFIQQWIRHTPTVFGRVLWIPHRDGNADYNRVLSTLVRGLESISGSSRSAAQLASATLNPDSNDEIRYLLSQAETLRSPVHLVIEDLHLFPDFRVIELLRTLLTQSDRFKVLVTTRNASELFSIQSRARIDTYLIDSREFAFSRLETANLQKVLMGTESKFASAVYEATHGWPLATFALLRIASDLKDQAPPKVSVLSRAFVEEYLESVFFTAPVGSRLFLLRLSQCHFFDTDLAAQINSLEAAETLKQIGFLESLGIVEVGREGTKAHYQIRPLFRASLKKLSGQELDQNSRNQILNHFVSWCENFDPSIAFGIYCETNELAEAERLLAQNFSYLTDLDTSSTSKVLSRIPMSALGAYPLLLGARFLTELADSSTPSSWLQRKYHQLIQALERHTDHRAAYQVLARAALLSAINRAMGDGSTAKEYAHQTALLLEQRNPDAYLHVSKSIPLAHALVALTYAHIEDYELSFHHYKMCTREAECGEDPQEINRGLGGRAYAAALKGDMSEAQKWASRSERFRLESPHMIYLGKINTEIALAFIGIENFDLEASRVALERIGPDYFRLESWPRIAMAHTLVHRQSDGPWVAQAQLHEVLQSGGGRPPLVDGLHAQLHSFQAQLLVQTGSLGEASEILADLNPDHPAVSLTQAYLSLHTGSFSQASLLSQKTLRTLAKFYPSAYRYRIPAMLYHSLASMHTGAMSLAMNEGFRLLKLVRTLGLYSPFLAVPRKDLIELFTHLDETRNTGALETLARIPSLADTPSLKSELTKTEQLILTAISRQNTVPQVASSLFLSTNTVKFHVKNIYKKLRVTNRQEALARARTLRLL